MAFSASSSVDRTNREFFLSFKAREILRSRFSHASIDQTREYSIAHVHCVDHMHITKSVKAWLLRVLSDISVLASGLVATNSALGYASCASFDYSTGSIILIYPIIHSDPCLNYYYIHVRCFTCTQVVITQKLNVSMCLFTCTWVLWFLNVTLKH